MGRPKAHQKADFEAVIPLTEGERSPARGRVVYVRGSTLFAVLLIAFAACKSNGPAASASSEVKPLIGTGGLGYAVGSVPPGPSHPFGLAKPGPDTATDGALPDFEHCAGYWSEDKDIRGFSQIHLEGTGLPDYGILMVMPMLAVPDGPILETSYTQHIDHHLEKAEVGSYQVTLLPSAIGVEITATPHTSLYRITYPKAQPANLIVSLAHSLNGKTPDTSLAIDPMSRTITGDILYQGKISKGDGIRLFFAMRFDQPFASTETFLGPDRSPGSTSAQGAGVGALLSFGPSLSAPLHVQIGLSFIDVDTATKNLDAEWMRFDFEKARAANRSAWDQILGLVEIEGGTPDHRAAFYSALYHLHFMPTLFTEAGGNYRGIDGQVHNASGFTYYSDFSLWDTFRTFHPLIALLEPDRAADFSSSLLAMTDQSGRIPKWPLATGESDVMIGYHGETVLADSFLKGIPGDGEKIYSYIRASAVDPRAPNAPMSLRQRDCLVPYLDHGYCPSDAEGGSGSKTLENAFDDFVTAALAQKLGHADDAAMFTARVQNWRKLANADGLVQGRKSDGSFTDNFREDLFNGDFVEGNSRQWSTFVPHDVEGLAEVRGGTDKAVAWLDGLFQISASMTWTPLPELGFWAGNEPDIHAPYLFAELGRPDLGDKWLDWVINNRYGVTPAGLPGNDDGGTMSSWYVFSALGFYPKLGENRYVLGKPLFPKAVVHLGAKTLTIVANNFSEKAIYVKNVRFNGRSLASPFVDHADLIGGGELVFDMSDTP
jgi:predicted alpha-1,2-mannosidase